MPIPIPTPVSLERRESSVVLEQWISKHRGKHPIKVRRFNLESVTLLLPSSQGKRPPGGLQAGYGGTG